MKNDAVFDCTAGPWPLSTPGERRWLASLAGTDRPEMGWTSLQRWMVYPIKIHKAAVKTLLVCLMGSQLSPKLAFCQQVSSRFYPLSLYSTLAIHGQAFTLVACHRTSHRWNTVEHDGVWIWIVIRFRNTSKIRSTGILWRNLLAPAKWYIWLGYPAFRIVIHLLLHSWRLANSCEAAYGWLRNLHVDILPSALKSW